MKKYLKMLPIMIYPYIYIICLGLYVFACSQFSGVDVQAYGSLGLLMSVWGIGFIMLAILMDVLSIFLTGMVGIGAAIACAKQKVLSKGGAVIYAILNFIFCVDVVSSIIYFIVIRQRSKQQTPAGQTTN